MDREDYLEIEGLLRGAAQMLVAGQLNDWQHANTSTFHLLATAILDLNERITAIAQLMDSATLASDKPPKSRIVVE